MTAILHFRDQSLAVIFRDVLPLTGSNTIELCKVVGLAGCLQRWHCWRSWLELCGISSVRGRVIQLRYRPRFPSPILNITTHRRSFPVPRRKPIPNATWQANRKACAPPACVCRAISRSQESPSQAFRVGYSCAIRLQPPGAGPPSAVGAGCPPQRSQTDHR